MGEYTVYAAVVTSLSGGAMGAIIAWGVTERREKVSRRRRFSDQIASLLVDLQDTGVDGPQQFFDATRRIVLIECAKIRRDIRRRDRPAFKTAEEDYRQWGERGRRALAEMTSYRLSHSSNVPLPEQADKRTNKEQLQDALQKLLECAR